MSLPKTGIEPLDNYCESVQTGEKLAGEYVKLAVQRHYDDLEKYGINHYDTEADAFEKEPEPDPKYYFDPAAVRYYVSFFEDHLKHYDGVFAGNPFEFEPWQWFALASPFGWLKYERISDMPIRRFDEMDVIIPKKQGKSIWIAGTMLYMLEYDHYPGAQIYSLAINRSHAETLGYRDAEIMVQNSDLEYNVKMGAAYRGIYFEPNNAHVKPLVSKEQIADGPKIHMAANDEVKDWDNFQLYETLVNGTASDPTAMIINITTAGSNQLSLGYERQEYIESVLDGMIEDEQTFGVVFTISKDDEKEFKEALAERKEYEEIEHIVKKANPNYGVTVGSDYYRKRYTTAQTNQHNRNSFLRKHLNVWTESLDGWLDMGAWDKCKDPDLNIGDVMDLECTVPIDLSSKIDLTGVGKVFTDGKEAWVFVDFYLPQRVLTDEDRYTDAMRGQIKAWSDQGWIHIIPGETIDQDYIQEDVEDCFRRYDVRDMPFDPWNANQFINNLQKAGIDVDKMTEYSQSGYKPWTEAMKTTEKMILEGNLHHNGNPVLRWNMSNVAVREDHNDNIRPIKENPQNKIDGAVIVFMGISRAIVANEEEETGGEVFVI